MQCSVGPDGGAQHSDIVIGGRIGGMRFAALPPAGVLTLDLGDPLQSRSRARVAGDTAAAVDRRVGESQVSITSHLLLQVSLPDIPGVVDAFRARTGPAS